MTGATSTKSYPNASERKVRVLYSAIQQGMSKYGLKMLADDLK